MYALTQMLKRFAMTSPLLTAVSLVMVPVLVLNLAGLILDPRLIAGAPAWMKPAKFAASTAIYGLTMVWVFTYLDAWPRLRRLVGGMTAAVFVLEVGIINLQAWRGTTSHFNVSTPFDATLFSIMGAAIMLQTFSSIAVAAALWRTRIADRALGAAVRTGMTIAIAGAMVGGLMTRPTATQMEQMKAGERARIVGAHTVGAVDGQPGLPVTGWSTSHGDMRVPHFVGLHAFQVLPIIAVALRRRGVTSLAGARVTTVASISYAALFAVLLAQALSGQSFVAPHQTFVIAYAVWALVTLVGFAVAGQTRERRGRRDLSAHQNEMSAVSANSAFHL